MNGAAMGPSTWTLTLRLVPLELPGIDTVGGRQADVAAAVVREVLRFDRDAVVSEVGRASDDHHP